VELAAMAFPAGFDVDGAGMRWPHPMSADPDPAIAMAHPIAADPDELAAGSRRDGLGIRGWRGFPDDDHLFLWWRGFLDDDHLLRRWSGLFVNADADLGIPMMMMVARGQ